MVLDSGGSGHTHGARGMEWWLMQVGVDPVPCWHTSAGRGKHFPGPQTGGAAWCSMGAEIWLIWGLPHAPDKEEALVRSWRGVQGTCLPSIATLTARPHLGRQVSAKLPCCHGRIWGRSEFGVKRVLLRFKTELQ